MVAAPPVAPAGTTIPGGAFPFFARLEFHGGWNGKRGRRGNGEWRDPRSREAVINCSGQALAAGYRFRCGGRVARWPELFGVNRSTSRFRCGRTSREWSGTAERFADGAFVRRVTRLPTSAVRCWSSRMTSAVVRGRRPGRKWSRTSEWCRRGAPSGTAGRPISGWVDRALGRGRPRAARPRVGQFQRPLGRSDQFGVRVGTDTAQCRRQLLGLQAQPEQRQLFPLGHPASEGHPMSGATGEERCRESRAEPLYGLSRRKSSTSAAVGAVAGPGLVTAMAAAALARRAACGGVRPESRPAASTPA